MMEPIAHILLMYMNVLECVITHTKFVCKSCQILLRYLPFLTFFSIFWKRKVSISWHPMDVTGTNEDCRVIHQGCQTDSADPRIPRQPQTKKASGETTLGQPPEHDLTNVLRFCQEPRIFLRTFSSRSRGLDQAQLSSLHPVHPCSVLQLRVRWRADILDISRKQSFIWQHGRFVSNKFWGIQLLNKSLSVLWIGWSLWSAVW